MMCTVVILYLYIIARLKAKAQLQRMVCKYPKSDVVFVVMIGSLQSLDFLGTFLQSFHIHSDLMDRSL